VANVPHAAAVKELERRSAHGVMGQVSTGPPCVQGSTVQGHLMPACCARPSLHYSSWCTCVRVWGWLHLSAHQDMASCSCHAGAMMVGDTLFRSSDGGSHCPVCKGKVSFESRCKRCLLPSHPAAVSIVCWHENCPLTARLEESPCMLCK
jgi:hypothetical protein